MDDDRRDLIEEAIGQTVDSDWVCTNYVTVAAFERFHDDGEQGSATVLFVRQSQPDFASEGLLRAGLRIQLGGSESSDEG